MVVLGRGWWFWDRLGVGWGYDFVAGDCGQGPVGEDCGLWFWWWGVGSGGGRF